MRPLFSDAPILQPVARMPPAPVGSQLAAALSGGRPPLSLPQTNVGGSIPLASMMQAMKSGSGDGVTSSTPNLVWNPNNPVGTETLGGNTANQGSWLGNAAASYLPGYQGGPPSSSAAPSNGYQPTSADQGLMATINQNGALAPQYQQQMQPQPPPQVQGAPPGMPTPGGPGQLGMLGQMFGGLFSGSGMGGGGMSGGGM